MKARNLFLVAILVLAAFCSCTHSEATLILDPNNGAEQTVYIDKTRKAYHLPTPERTGYTFDCWFDAEGNTFAPESIIHLPDNDGGVMHLYGRWNTTITIKTKAGDVKQTIQTGTDKAIASFPIPLSFGTYYNYQTKAEGTGVYSTYKAPKTGPNENIVIYLKENMEVGDYGPAGGYVFYDCDADNGEYLNDKLVSSECGWRYIEISPVVATVGDQTSFVFGYVRTTPTGPNTFVNGAVYGSYEAGTTSATDGKCTGTAIGTGRANTTKLLAVMGDNAYANITGPETTAFYAAKVCEDFVYGGYDDWFLGSEKEMLRAFSVINQSGLFGFDSVICWSSSENIYNPGQAYSCFTTSTSGTSSVGGKNSVLPVRTFNLE